MPLSEALLYTLPDWCHPASDIPAELMPQDSGLHLAVLAFDEQGFQERDFRDSGIVPPTAMSRAARKRQAEFLAGRLCAGQAIRQFSGIMRFPGKDTDGVPLWPGQACGSITHSAGVAMAVVGHGTRYPNLGLDLEVVQNHTEARSLTSLVLTPTEQFRFRGQLSGAPGPCLTRIFSLKEALFKALFPLTRQRFYFQDAEVTHMADNGLCEMHLLTTLSEDWPGGSRVPARLVDWHDRVVSLVMPRQNRQRR